MERPRALVLAAGSLGDCILTLPALQALQVGHDVTVAGTRPFLALGPDLIGVSDVTGFEPVYEGILAGNPVPGLDAFGKVFLFFKESAPTLEERLGECGRHTLIPAISFDGFLRERRYAGEYWMRFLEENGVSVANRMPRLFPNDLLLSSGRDLLKDLGLERPVVIHPGSGGVPKTAPLPFFRRIAGEQAANHPVLVVWGEAEEKRLPEIRESFRDLPGVVVLASPMTLQQLTAVLCLSHSYFGNDSGVTHLAAACGIPVTAAFGPTDPAVWAPPGARLTQWGQA